MSLLRARGLGKSYHRGPERVRAVDGVDLELRAGEVAVLVGPSGSGKSTLLGMLAGWERPDRGEILWEGAPADPRALPWAALSVLPQAFGLLEELSVRENVELPARLGAPAEIDRAALLLAELGLEELADRQPAELSVGEQQRAGLARALLLRPRLLLADEPTGHQDAESAARVLRLIHEAAAEGSACLVATHAEETVEVADRVLAMRDGRLVDPGMLRA